MSDKHIEKLFLYLLALSVLIHVAVFAIILLTPQEKQIPKQEPYMVELRDLPEVKQPAPIEIKKEKKMEVSKEKKEFKPKVESQKQKFAAPSKLLPPPESHGPSVPPVIKPQPAQTTKDRGKAPQETGESNGMRPDRSGEMLLKPKGQPLPPLAKLFPSANRLANLEENYRKKYESGRWRDGLSQYGRHSLWFISSPF